MTLTGRLLLSRLRRSSELAVPLAEDDDRTLRKDGVRIVESESSEARAQVKQIDVSRKTEGPVSPKSGRPPCPRIRPSRPRGLSVLLGLSQPCSTSKNKRYSPPSSLSPPSPAASPPSTSLVLDLGDPEAPLPASPLSHHSTAPTTSSSAASPLTLAFVPDSPLSTAPSSPERTASPPAPEDDDRSGSGLGGARAVEPRSKFSSWSSLASASSALDPAGGGGALVDDWRRAVHELDDGDALQRADELAVASAFAAPLDWSYPELAVALVGARTRQRGRRASTGGVGVG
ncbi:hypothetical protein JCM1841_005848 [Sporobolomyces salmonicolor]